MGFGSVVGSVVSGVGSLVGGVMNHKESRENREFQENMANTSVRRRVEDMKAAGLNPLLAVSSASAGAPQPSSSPVSYDVSGIANAAQLMANADKLKAETENIRMETANKELQGVSQRLDNVLKQNDINTMDFRNKMLAAQTEQEFNKVITTQLDNKKISQDIKNMIVRTAQEEWNLNRDKNDYGQTKEGLREKHDTATFGKEYTLGKKSVNVLTHPYKNLRRVRANDNYNHYDVKGLNYGGFRY